MRTRTLHSALGLGLVLAAACSNVDSEQAMQIEPGVATVQQADTLDDWQKLMDRLFATSNLLTVTIKMDNFYSINDPSGGRDHDGWSLEILSARLLPFGSRVAVG